jgi:diguanylate cyclase (GGDEF)-like protein/PAS domain S-box-containing protein
VNGCWDNTRFRLVADRLLAPVAVLDSDTTILYVNHAATAVLAADASQLLGQPLVRFVHPDDNDRVLRDLCDVTAGRAGRSIDFRIRVNRREEWTVVESIADNLLDDPSIEGIVLSIRDVTAQHALQRQLRDAAYVDALTSLPNRLSIIEQLEKLMTGTGDISVAFVGIDRFDLINHSFGHSLGDSVLLSVVGRLRSCLPSAAILGRLTGNVFVVVIADATATHARSIAWRALERVGEPLFLGGHELRLSLSAGLAYRDPAATAASLLRDADLALRRAMGGGGGRVESFVMEMRDEAIGRLELEARMRRAIAHAEFSLEVQPIVRIPTRRRRRRPRRALGFGQSGVHRTDAGDRWLGPRADGWQRHPPRPPRRPIRRRRRSALLVRGHPRDEHLDRRAQHHRHQRVRLTGLSRRAGAPGSRSRGVEPTAKAVCGRPSFEWADQHQLVGWFGKCSDPRDAMGLHLSCEGGGQHAEASAVASTHRLVLGDCAPRTCSCNSVVRVWVSRVSSVFRRSSCSWVA